MFEKAKVGDVIWSERHGQCKIIKIRDDDLYPIILSPPEGGDGVSCTVCGREMHGDVKPSYFWSEPKYEIPPRPKRMVKKQLTGWVNIYPSGPGSMIYPSREEADMCAGSRRIACAELTGPYEVEE